MEVSVEALEGLERRMTVQIPSERIDTEVKKRLEDLTRKARIDGFRPGKVPFKVIKGRYGRAVRDEVTSEVLQQSYLEAIKEQELRPAGGPSLDASPTAGEEGFSFSATFEVYPEFEPGGIEELAITRPASEVTDEDVETMVERLRKQRATWKSTDRKAAQGDRVTIDFKGSVDGEEVESASGQDLTVELGVGGFVPGFEDNLMGLTADEVKDFEVKFPEDYPAEALAAKDVAFNVTVKSVEESELPALDEAFINSFGVANGELEALREELKRNMERELRSATTNRLRQQVMDGLLAANPIPLPKVLIEEQMWHIAVEGGAVDEKDVKARTPLSPELAERLRPAAERQVALGLIVSEIVKRNKIQVEDTRIASHIDTIASTYEDPDQIRAWYRSNERAMDMIRNQAMEERFLDWVMEHAKVVEKSMSFDEVVNSEGKLS